MNSRKRLVLFDAVLILGLATALWSAEKDFPSKPIHFIVPYAAGGGQDMLARGISPFLEKHLGVPIQIENIPGAGGKMGFTRVWKANPDGYTLMNYILPVPIILENLSKVDYRTKEFTAIFAWSEVNQVLVVNGDGFRTFEEFLQTAKTRPLSAGLPGRGTSAHLAGLLAADGLGIKVNWVPFSGGSEALTALAGKHIDLAIVVASTALSLVRGGKLRPLIVFAEEKDPVYPEVPTPKEKGYKIPTVSSLRGVVGPPKLPVTISTPLEKAFEKAIKEPGYMEWAVKAKTEIAPVSSREYQKIIEGQYSLVEKYIHLLN